MAARVMSEAERNQILLTSEAYNQLIEMEEDPTLSDKFQDFDVELKHGLQVQIYQYCNQADTFVNSQPPKDLINAKRVEVVMDALRQSGLPMPDHRAFDKIDKDKMLDSMEAFANLFAMKELPQLSNLDIQPDEV
jgi:hypothetical protein